MKLGALAALGAMLVLGGCASGGGRVDGSSTVAGGVSQGTDDQQLVAFLDEERRKPGGKGLIVIGGEAPDCIAPVIAIEQVLAGKYLQAGTFRASRSEPYALPAGEYLVTFAGCGSTGGPHAKFTVMSGEIVNVGTLVVENKEVASLLLVGRGAMRRTVGPMNPDRLSRLKQEFPMLMAKLVHRPMSIAGPEQFGIRLQSRRY